MKSLLGVNIDHIATLRNIRNVSYPDPVQAALFAEKVGADSITVHLREDRRHINDKDVQMLCQKLKIPVNLEMAATEEMVVIACENKPCFCCLVPERRKEVTTEGGLDVARQLVTLRGFCTRLESCGIRVSLFINADYSQVDAAVAVGASSIEIHTGAYANAENEKIQKEELDNITNVADYATDRGLRVNAGHGLNYQNVERIAALPNIQDINVGHAIIGRSVMTGLEEAISYMKGLIMEASG